MKKITASGTPTLKDDVELYIALDAQKKEIDKKMKKLKAGFIKDVFENEIEDGEKLYEANLGTEVALTYELVDLTRFDTKNFKEEQADLYARYNKPAVNRVLKAYIKD